MPLKVSSAKQQKCDLHRNSFGPSVRKKQNSMISFGHKCFSLCRDRQHPSWYHGWKHSWAWKCNNLQRWRRPMEWFWWFWLSESILGRDSAIRSSSYRLAGHEDFGVQDWNPRHQWHQPHAPSYKTEQKCHLYCSRWKCTRFQRNHFLISSAAPVPSTDPEIFPEGTFEAGEQGVLVIHFHSNPEPMWLSW